MPAEAPGVHTGRRDQILAAAESCFGSLGVAETSMEAIAREAGLSRATVYRHFTSRDALLLELVLVRSREVLDRGVELMEQASGMASALEAAMVYAVQVFPGDPWIREVMRLNPSAALTSEPVLALARDAFRAFHLRYRAQGELRSDLGLDDLVAWILRQLFVIYRDGAADEADIRRDVAMFLVPALRVPAAPAAPEAGPAGRVTMREVADRLDRLEQQVRLLTDAIANATS